MKTYNLFCVTCGDKMQVTRIDAKTHNTECRVKLSITKKGLQKVEEDKKVFRFYCLICGKVSDVNNSEQVTCNTECRIALQYFKNPNIVEEGSEAPDKELLKQVEQRVDEVKSTQIGFYKKKEK